MQVVIATLHGPLAISSVGVEMKELVFIIAFFWIVMLGIMGYCAHVKPIHVLKVGDCVEARGITFKVTRIGPYSFLVINKYGWVEQFSAEDKFAMTDCFNLFDNVVIKE